MKRLKTFGKYILLVVGFFFFSRILIFIGLNNTYDNIELRGTVPEGIIITSSKATSVNGEVKGKISENLDAKYVKFNFYTDIGSLAGSYYITPSELEDSNFEFYYKLNYIESYSIELADEKPEAVHLDSFSSSEFKGYAILTAFVMLIFI